MKFSERPVPDYEVIVCSPEESFRWFVHDYPHHLAKWHHHPEYELHLTRSGAGTMMVGDHLGEFAPGCLVLTGPNVPHSWLSTLAPGEVLKNRDMLVQFTADWADRVGSLCPEFAALSALLQDASFGVEFTGETASACRTLLAEVGEAQGPERVIRFLRLLTRLAEEPGDRRRLSRLAPGAGPSGMPARLDAALRLISERYGEEVDLDAAAAACGLSPQAFSRLFKRQTGHTFASYLVLTRVYGACTLLTQTGRPITEICFEVGFNSVANFNRQFLKVCGRTPSAWRRDALRIATAARPDPFQGRKPGDAATAPMPPRSTAAGG